MLCRSLGVLAFLTALQCSNASADDVIHVVGPGLVLQAPLTADAMWARIREAASKYAEFAPVPRAAFFDITYPANRTEYDDLAGFGVLLVTVVTQDAAELPVPRVYLEGARVRHDFRLLSSVKSPVPEPSVVRVLGPHRFDALYVFPMHLRREAGELRADFAIHRTGFVLAKFPLYLGKDDLPTTPPTGPAPPDGALIKLLKRELPSFVSGQPKK